MKTLLFLLSLVCLSSCAQSGYSPSYIISDAEKEERSEKGL